MEFRFCDDLGANGFGWVVDEAMTRTSHALAADGKVWLVDALDWPEAIERALALGEPSGVIQLLDRHDRDCAALAARLSVPQVVAPDELPGSPFTCVPIMRRKRWRESALWWPEARTLVTADAFGTSRFYTGGKAPLGVHVLLRLNPPRKLGAFEAEHVLRPWRGSPRSERARRAPRRPANEPPRASGRAPTPAVRRPRLDG